MAGFAHVRVEGTAFLKDNRMSGVIRSDGVKVASANYWISQERNPASPANPRYFVNIFDYHAAGVQTEELEDHALVRRNGG